MGCCNEPVTALSDTTPDPSQHVHFAKGMVLGVDDFNQEFVHLAGLNRWLAHDAIGYGTLSGLRVLAKAGGAEGPQLQVLSGTALVPSGKLVCVGADQCAVINKWLAKSENAAIVNRLLNPASPPLSPPGIVSPPAVTSGRISLFLTLCYADCLTRPVPIPGEACRSEDELMEKSRVAEDFRLELRERPPLQIEEDALRDFVQWLRVNVQVVGTPSPAGDDESWLNALRPAAQPWFDPEALSPPASPPAAVDTLGDYLVDLPSPLAVGPDQLCAFLRVAFRFWVTELRPLWMAMRCHRAVQGDVDCVLLARVEFEVDWIGGSPAGAWQIIGSPATIVVDETRRPFIAHLRLLQEWALCGCDCAGLGAAAAVTSPPLIPFAMEGMSLGPSLFSRTTGRPPVSVPRLPVLVTSRDVALDESQYCIVCRGGHPLRLTLPPSNPAHAGRVYVIKNADAGMVSLSADTGAGDVIEEGGSVRVKKHTALTVIADGAGHWHVIGQDL